ncbi:uncharacterized protein LOC109514609 isoform X2 [Hippocampus comes]|uniref:uncharacterized protein LOC109514609 isoform X2 n=1 Tax=Hippocampus comes TaxID=109280 RepID=UPI00094E08E1|nr:PREDICTED: uncharacterized protein LOC109514609 isoform X2 [Hippocampus comes]
MACGIYLGVLLICLLPAEHVHCLWASQEAQGKTYVGFVQDEGGTGKPPQNQFRQASAQSGSRGGVSDFGDQQSKLSSYLGSYSSLRVVRRHPLGVSGKKAGPQKPRLSTAIASSGSLSRFQPPKSNLAAGLKKPNAGPHSRGKSSGLFLPGYGMRKFSPNMQTSANGTATKVLIGHKPGRQRKIYRSHGRVGFQSQRQQVTSVSSDAGFNGRRYAPTHVLTIPSRFGGARIRRLKHTAPQKSRGVKLAPRLAHQETKWARVKLRH